MGDLGAENAATNLLKSTYEVTVSVFPKVADGIFTRAKGYTRGPTSRSEFTSL